MSCLFEGCLFAWIGVGGGWVWGSINWCWGQVLVDTSGLDGGWAGLGWLARQPGGWIYSNQQTSLFYDTNGSDEHDDSNTTLLINGFELGRTYPAQTEGVNNRAGRRGSRCVWLFLFVRHCLPAGWFPRSLQREKGGTVSSAELAATDGIPVF